MALSAGEIEGLFKLRDEFTTVLRNAETALQRTGTAVQRVGSQMQTAGTALTVGLTLPITAFGTLVAKTASDFESAFAGVRKTVDATEPQFARLSAGFRELSWEIPLSVTELARIGEAAGQLGIETDNILGFTRVMADLGVTTNLSSDQAATALARFANITGMSQDKFSNLGSTIVALGNQFATTEAEIVEFSLRIAGAGEIAGLTEAQILAIATAVSSVGIEAEAGGTAVQKVLLGMTEAVATSNDDLVAFAATAGMSAQQFASAFRDDAGQAFEAFVRGLGTAGTEAFQILEQLGLEDQRLIRTFISLAGAGDLLTRTLQEATPAWEQNVALAEEARKRYDTVASQVAILWNRFKDVTITLGTALLPTIRMMISALQEATPWLQAMAQRFSELPSAVQIGSLAIVGLIAVTGPLLVAVGQLSLGLTALSGLFTTTAVSASVAGAAVQATAASTTTATGIFTALRLAIAGLVSPFGLVVTAIVGGGGLLWALGVFDTETTTFRARLDRLVETIGEAGQALTGFGRRAGEARREMEVARWRAFTEDVERLSAALATLRFLPPVPPSPFQRFTQGIEPAISGLERFTSGYRRGVIEAEPFNEALLSSNDGLDLIANTVDAKVLAALERTTDEFDNVADAADEAREAFELITITSAEMFTAHRLGQPFLLLTDQAIQAMSRSLPIVHDQMERLTDSVLTISTAMEASWAGSITRSVNALAGGGRMSLGTVLGDLSQSLSYMSQSGGPLGAFAEGLSTITTASNVAVKAGETLASSLEAIGEGDATGVLSMTASVMSLVSAMDQATSSGSRFQNVLGGASTGASFGAAFGPIGAGVGALAGGIAGALRGTDTEAERAARRAAIAQAEEAAEALEAFYLEYQGFLSQIGGDIVGVQRLAQQAGVDISDLFQLQTVEEFSEALSRVRNEFAETFEAGVENAVGGLTLLVGGWYDATSQTYEAASQSIEDFGAESQAAFDRFGLYTASAFAGVLLETGSLFEALEQLDPVLGQLEDATDAWKLSAGSAVSELLRIRAFGELHPELMDQLEGVNQLMEGLWTSGLITQATFESLGQDAVRIFNDITSGGMDSNTAMALMRPTLQQLWEGVQDYGLEVDDATQALLDQAVTMGMVGETHRSVNEQMLTAMLGMSDAITEQLIPALERIADVLTLGVTPAVDIVTDGINDAASAAMDFADAFDAVMSDAASRAAEGLRIPIEYVSQVSPERRDRYESMAAGGIVTRPTLALVGEAGPEAVIPLRQMGGDDAVVRELRALRSELVTQQRALPTILRLAMRDSQDRR